MPAFTTLLRRHFIMSQNKKETSIYIKPTYERHVAIDENIHSTLSLSALTLYMAFRYEADYRQKESDIKRSAQYLYTKAKISRAQYYRALNELEGNGLVIRDESNALGEKCTFHIAKELGYFARGVSERDRGVSPRDTDHNSSSNSNINITINSEFQNSPTPEIKGKKKNSLELMELINIYRELFPHNPQPHKRVISTSLKKTLLTLVKRWPELDPNGNALTYEAFKRYLIALKSSAPKFALGEYVTDEGNRKKNGLETFARWNTVVKFLENAYS